MSIELESRKQQIAELLLQGCSNKEIARELNISLNAVKKHFNHQFLRLGILGSRRGKRVKLATMLNKQSGHEKQPTNVVFTERQWCIIASVAEGLTNQEIADRLGTTELYLKNLMIPIYDKVGVNNKLELALWFESRQGV